MGIENHFSAWLELSYNTREYIVTKATSKNPGACLTQVESFDGPNFIPGSVSRPFPAE